MTPRAIGFAGQILVHVGVHAGADIEAPPDFGVTFQTFETAGARPEGVAGRALPHTLQLLVGESERPRRDLRRCRPAQRHRDQGDGE
jgi:hypothetical protein